MTAQEWMDANANYLSASLESTRKRLESVTRYENIPAPAAIPADEAPRPPRFRRKSRPEPADEPKLLLPQGTVASVGEQVVQAEAKRDEAAKSEVPPALIMLAERFGMSAFERDTLLLCASMELDTGFASLCAKAHGNPSMNYPTFGLAMSALVDPSWEALSAQRPLRYSQLIEVVQHGSLPLISSPLRADERVVNFLKGLNQLDERLASLLAPTPIPQGSLLAGSQQTALETILDRIEHTPEGTMLPVFQLIGPDSASKVEIARQASAALGRQLYRMGPEALPSQVTEVETLGRLWQRESLLLPVSLYIDTDDAESAAPELRSALHRFLSRGVGLVFVGSREVRDRLGTASFPVLVDKPTSAEQHAAWISVLEARGKPDAERSAQLLAGQFNLGLEEIHQTAAAFAGDEEDAEPAAERLWRACRDVARPGLDRLAERLELKATWDDLVLPEEPMALLKQIAGQVRERYTVYDEWGFTGKMNRGYGISALFTGESGTGKTMAAEVIANELKLNLYRIDLSGVVSKYIGETEKNLRRLFDAAEQGGAILFFDEADALFGKRSEVKDSHDRYANIEINYLLQRMEAFGGLAILATNMKGALDQAFMRRLRFIVNFQFPGVVERRRIWERAFPPSLPKEELDLDRLAKLAVTGGNIHSIALNAAFMAAQNGKSVTMPKVLAAARMELRKLEKPINEADFR